MTTEINRLDNLDEITRLAETKIASEQAQYAPKTQGPKGQKGDSRTIDPLGILGQEFAIVAKAIENGEKGDSDVFVELFMGKLLYDHASGKWHQWAGHYWERDRLQEALAAVDEVVNFYGQAAVRCSARAVEFTKRGKTDECKAARDLESKILETIPKLQAVRRRKSILEFAASGQGRLGCTGDEWDSQPYLLPFLNGVVDLRTGKLRPGKQDDYLRTVIPHEYAMLRIAAKWTRFLAEIFNNDHELINYLQRLLGHCLIGEVTEHVFPILWGSGRNGKGTLLETLQYVLGPLAGPVKSELLLEQKWSRSSGSPDSDLMSLRGRRLAWASETGQGRKLDYGKVKWLCGGDSIVAREPYAKEESRWKPSHHLFLLTNHKPRIDAQEEAMWQRVRLIPFTERFLAKDAMGDDGAHVADPELPRQLQTEVHGILNWLIEGCMLYQQQGLGRPKAVRDATKEYRSSEDVIAKFLAEECMELPSASSRAGALWDRYQTWCQAGGTAKTNKSKFNEYMEERFRKVKIQNRYVEYQGVGLLATEVQNQEAYEN